MGSSSIERVASPRHPHTETPPASGTVTVNVTKGASAAAPEWDNLDGRTLRLAVAMRGGVSLAVWIGGVVAELDLLRSLRVYRKGEDVRVDLLWTGAAPAQALLDRAAVYGELLMRRRYHRVEFDVLAGASAGGLNSVLFGVAQRTGSPYRRVLDIWLQTGSIARLLRRPAWGRVRSVLQGDEYFFPQVLGALQDFTSTPGPEALRTEFVSVDLSATVLNAQDAAQPEIAEGRAGFHFRGDSPGNDIPAASDPRSLRRLALAARTTSSFPGAFEPATIWSMRDPAQKVPRGDTAPGHEARTLDLSAAFIAHRNVPEGYAATQYLVIDGGVFDNIPIARAFRAIRPRASLAPTTRGVLYLDPTPPVTPPIPPRVTGRSVDLISVVTKALNAKTQGETSRDDVEEIYDKVLARFVGAGRIEAFASTLHTLPWDRAHALRREYAYVRARASRDIAFLSQIAKDLASWQMAEDIPPAARFFGSPEAAQKRIDVLEAQLIRDANASTGDEGSPERARRVSRDAIAVSDAALWLLGCVQWMEDTLISVAEEQHPPHTYGEFRAAVMAALAPVRGCCYRAFSAADANRRSAVLAVLHAAPGNEAAAWRQSADETDWAVLGDALRALREVGARWEEYATSPEAQEVPTGRPYPLRTWWTESMWRPVLLAPAQMLDVYDIAALFSPLGEPDPLREPRYVEIAATWDHGAPGDEVLTRALGSLAGRRDLTVVQAILDDAEGRDHEQDAERADTIARATFAPDATAAIPAKTKLAGTTLFNFGGFLSQDWRRGDWWWGRIDAAAELTKMLDGEQPAQAGALVAAELAAEDTRAAATLTSGLGGLDRLKPHYLYDVVSQLGRLVARALPGAPKHWQATLIHLALFFTRPLAVPLPAVVDPRRLGGVVMLLLSGWALAAASSDVGAPRAPRDTNIWFAGGLVAAVAAVVVVIVFAASSRRAAYRWGVAESAIGKALGGAASAVIDPVRQTRRRATRHARWLSVLGLLCVLACATAALAGHLTLASAWAVLGIVLVIVAGQVRRTALAEAVHGWYRHSTTSVAIAAVVAAAALAVLLWAWLAPEHPGLAWLGFAEAGFGRGGFWLWAGFVAASLVLLRAPRWLIDQVAGLAAALVLAGFAVWAAAASDFALWLWVAGIVLWANVLWLLPSAWAWQWPGAAERARADDLASPAQP